MPAEPIEHSARRTRSVDRLISFSDGVVAVAITLLALPLVDLLPRDGQSVWDLVRENLGPMLAFLFTFAVVAIMWAAHNRILNGIADYDGVLFWLNVAWLAGIVLLPWFSSLFGATEMLGSGNGGADAGLLYWGTMAVISAIGWAMSYHLSRRPDLLLEPNEIGRAARGGMRGLVFAAWFLLIGLCCVIAPVLGSWLPLGIIPLSIWLRPGRGAQNQMA